MFNPQKLQDINRSIDQVRQEITRVTTEADRVTESSRQQMQSVHNSARSAIRQLDDLQSEVSRLASEWATSQNTFGGLGAASGYGGGGAGRPDPTEIVRQVTQHVLQQLGYGQQQASLPFASGPNAGQQRPQG